MSTYKNSPWLHQNKSQTNIHQGFFCSLPPEVLPFITYNVVDAVLAAKIPFEFQGPSCFLHPIISCMYFFMHVATTHYSETFIVCCSFALVSIFFSNTVGYAPFIVYGCITTLTPLFSSKIVNF